MMLFARLNKTSLREVERDLALLTLNPKKKKQILTQALKRIKKEANQNKRKQQTPDGKAWQPRKKAKFTYTKNGKQKPKKMLMKILNKSNIKVNGDVGSLGFTSQRRSQVAGRHNYGGETPVNSTITKQ